jgi:4-amino-4-deoxychorismate lyase
MMATEESNIQLFSTLRFDILLLKSSANTLLNGSPSPFYMLRYHRDRILEAARCFKWPEAIKCMSGPEGLQHLLHKLEATIDITSSKPLRVKVVLFRDANIVVETNETPAVPLANLFPSRIPPPPPKTDISPLAGGALMSGADDSLQTRGPVQGEPEKRQSWSIKVDPSKTQPSLFTTYKTTQRDMYTGARGRVGIESMTDPTEVLIISNTGNEVMEGSLTSVYFWRNGRWVTPPVSSGGQAGTTRRWLLENRLCEEEVVARESLFDGEECWISNGVRGLTWGRVKL